MSNDFNKSSPEFQALMGRVLSNIMGEDVNVAPSPQKDYAPTPPMQDAAGSVSPAEQEASARRVIYASAADAAHWLIDTVNDQDCPVARLGAIAGLRKLFADINGKPFDMLLFTMRMVTLMLRGKYMELGIATAIIWLVATDRFAAGVWTAEQMKQLWAAGGASWNDEYPTDRATYNNRGLALAMIGFLGAQGHDALPQPAHYPVMNGVDG